MLFLRATQKFGWMFKVSFKGACFVRTVGKAIYGFWLGDLERNRAALG